MSVASSGLDVRDGHLGHAEVLSYLVLDDAASEHRPGLTHLIVGHLEDELSGVDVCTVANFVSRVFDGEFPTKVVGANIRRDAVFMGDLVSPCGLAPVEGAAYKLVNELGLLRSPSHGKLDGWIAAGFMEPRLESDCLGTFVRPNATEVANLVGWKIADYAPDFIRHSPVLTQVIG